ncbi:MAG TPA: PQQ-binding-like beta-propeller repeat protein [Verrucomicrobiae bacterium]|nr:PQQ-binding-like beta-propeller repeat protein [Verrucomicrobiae bacterium]
MTASLIPSIGPLLLLSLLGSSLESDGGDWPHWRGPDLNGISREKVTASWPAEGPRQLWKASVGIGFSSVAVAQGRVFTLGNKDETDTVYCFDAETGKELWTHAYLCPIDPKYYEGGPGSTPTVEGGRVYTLSKRGHLFCFEAAAGTVIWQKNLMEELGVKKPEWGFAGSPLVEGNLLVLNLGGAGTAIDKATGKIVWTSDTNAAGYATPVPFTAGDERCVAIFSGKALVGVRVKDGRELWRHPWVTKWDINSADPILVGDKLFVSTFDRGCALLQLTGVAPKVVWENKNMANHFNSCVYLNGFFYGIDGNTDQPAKDLRCVDGKTGDVKWKYDGPGLGSLMAADGKLIVLSERGELAVAEASPDAFKPLARAQVLGGKCWTTPVLANGRLYCRNARGDLVCLDVRTTGS